MDEVTIAENTTCRHCGNTEWVLQRQMDIEIKEGRMEGKKFGLVLEQQYSNPKKKYNIGDKITTLLMVSDFCTKCLANQVIRVERVELTLKLNPQSLLQIPGNKPSRGNGHLS